MRRETRNKKVLQAITIGLSAMMAATSMPVNVLAAGEEELNPKPVPAVDPSTTTSTNVADNAQQAATDAVTPVDTAIGATNTAAETIDKAITDANAGDTKENPNTGTSYATELDEAAQEITGDDQKGDLASPTGEITATGATDGINDDLADAELFGGAADAAIGVADGQAGDIKDATAAIEQTTEQAITDINNGINTINGAGTQAEADNAYAALQQVATEANTQFDNALSAYDTNLADYNAQLERIKILEAAFNTELGAAEGGAQKVKDELEKAKAEADKLKAAADAALANLNQQTQNMVEIDRLINKNNKDSGTNWQKDDGLRELFKKTMLFHYLPEAGILTQEEVFALQNQEGFDIDKVIESVERKNDSNYTYHKITVGEGENAKTYYFNYRLKEGTSKTDIIIFEKRGVEVLTDAELKELGFDQFDEYKNDAGTKVDVAAGLANGTVVAANNDADDANDLYVQLDGEGTTVAGNKEGDVLSTSADGKDETRIATIDAAEEVSYSYDETTGEVVKTVKQGATTVVYRQQRTEVIAEVNAILTEDKAKAELEKALAAKLETEGVKEYDKVAVDSTITETQEWEATGSYKPVFKDQVTIKTEFDRGFDGIRYDAEDIREEMEKQSATLLNAELKADGQTLVGNPEYQVNQWEDQSYTKYVLDYYKWGFIPIYKEVYVEKIVPFTTKAELQDTKLFDGNLFRYWTAERTADYQYTDSRTGTVTGTGATAEEAKANADAQIGNYKQTYGDAVGINNQSVSDAKMTGVTYSAWLTYWTKVEESEKETDVVTSTTTYANDKTSKLSGSIVQNKIYLDYMNNETYHDSLMSINDGKNGEQVEINWGLQEELDKAKALEKKYSDLQTEAGKTVKSYEAALAAVDKMQKEIDKIDERNTQLFSFEELSLTDMSAEDLIAYLAPILAEYQDVPSDVVDEGEELEDPTNIIKLVNSLRDLYDAANNLIAMNGLLGQAEGALREKIAELTPPESAPGTPGTGETPTTTPTTPVVATTAVPLPLMFAPGPAIAGIAAGAAGVGAGDEADGPALTEEDGLTDIADAPIPAGMSEEEAQDIIDELKDIKDKTIPMTDALDKETVGWWWWLLILLFGGAAVEAYRRYQKKQKAEVTQTNDSK